MDTNETGIGAIRNAGMADREVIRRLVNEAFIEERVLKKGNLDRLPDGSPELDRLMERGAFLLMADATGPVACVYVETRGSRAYLGLLSVTQSQQRTGVGRRMCAAAEELARFAGCQWMDLTVVSPRSDRLLPIYERLGYQVNGTEPYPPEVEQRMAVPGHFIRLEKRL